MPKIMKILPKKRGEGGNPEKAHKTAKVDKT